MNCIRLLLFGRTTLLADATYELMDKGIIDGILHLIARTIYSMAMARPLRGSGHQRRRGLDERPVPLHGQRIPLSANGQGTGIRAHLGLDRGGLAAVVLLINSGWLANIF